MEEKSPTEESDWKAKLGGGGEEMKDGEAKQLKEEEEEKEKEKKSNTWQFRGSGNTSCSYCGIWFLREKSPPVYCSCGVELCSDGFGYPTDCAHRHRCAGWTLTEKKVMVDCCEVCGAVDLPEQRCKKKEYPQGHSIMGGMHEVDGRRRRLKKIVCFACNEVCETVCYKNTNLQATDITPKTSLSHIFCSIGCSDSFMEYEWPEDEEETDKSAVSAELGQQWFALWGPASNWKEEKEIQPKTKRQRTVKDDVAAWADRCQRKGVTKV